MVQNHLLLCTSFTGAQESLEEKVTLKPCDTYDLSKIQTPADYQAVANSSEALEGIENTMNVWLKQLEQVRSRRVESW